MARPPTPPPIVIPNCIMVVLHWSDAAGEFSNVIHGNLTAVGPINPSLPETLFSAFKANAGISAWLSAHVSTGVSFIRVSCKDMRAGNNPTFQSSGLAAAGGAAGAQVPLQACIVVTHRTAQSGRAFRGRTYLGGGVVTDLASPRAWSDTTGTAAVAAVNGMQTVMTANQIPMVIAQQHLLAGTTAAGAALPDRAAGVVPITGFDIANPRVDSQRRRLGR